MGQPRKNIEDVSPIGRFFMALGMFCIGGFLIGISTGWVAVDPSTIHAPLWVLGAAGMVFALAGVMILLAGNERLAWLNNIVIWLFVVCLAGPFNWVAFGEGERHFTQRSATMGVASSGAASESEGRMIFGIIAVVIDLVVVLVPLRLLWKRGKKDDAEHS